MGGGEDKLHVHVYRGEARDRGEREEREERMTPCC